MNMKQSCKALICAIEGELDGRHCTEEQAAAILDHALPSLTEALARVEAELHAVHDMVTMLEEHEWAEHAGKGSISKGLEYCITTMQNELHEAHERADAAQAQLAEAVGLLRKVVSSSGFRDLADAEKAISYFLAQAEQQEAQGAQAGDDVEPAVSFAAWLIDHQESQVVTEEDVQAWLTEWNGTRDALATQPAVRGAEHE